MAYCKGRLNIFIPDKPVLHNEGSGVVTLILQVLFLNLIISFENVGIFALATAGMPANTATKVHRIGIAISLACTLILVAVTGVLFTIPWLHIRIVGGVLLLYIIEAAAFIYSDRFPAVAYFFPSYHFAAIVGHITSPYSVPMTMLIPVLYISLFAYIGYCRYQSQHGCSITSRK